MSQSLQHTIHGHGITTTLGFTVSANVTEPLTWRESIPGKTWEGRVDGLRCQVVLESHPRDITIYQLVITNEGSNPLDIHHFALGPEEVSWDDALTAPHALHALHSRVTGEDDYSTDKISGLNPLAPLLQGQWHELSERCAELPHFEGVVLTDGDKGPAFVEGPLTQNHAHQRKKVLWQGGNTIRFEIIHTFIGIPARTLAPGESLTESGFIQCRPDGDLNEALRDYLAALANSTGTRGGLNPLVSDRFFCTWNNFLYWEANEEEILASAARIRETLPVIGWYHLDDGYMVSKGSASVMERNERGERIHTLDKELPWFHNCPGISFLFDGGEGVDFQKFPNGLGGLTSKLREQGFRPGIWIGMEVSRHAPAALKHPDWFIDIGHESHLLPDLSVPEVQKQLHHAFKTLFHDWGFEAVKVDFVTHLTDHPDLAYRHHDKSGAEWRDWLFSTLRSYLPADGYITLGCWIAMGAPWLAPYIDSYRDSMDARDGNWQTVLSNVRWSILPALTGGADQPIPDADSVSVFKDMDKAAMETWINYARVGGMLVEAGGDVRRWNMHELAWVEKCLANERAGGRVYFADHEFWSRDGFPSASYREIGKETFLLGLYNWREETQTIRPVWTGPISACETFISLDSGATFTRRDLTAIELPGRTSRLFLTTLALPATEPTSIVALQQDLTKIQH